MTPTTPTRRRLRHLAVLCTAGIALTACSGGSPPRAGGSTGSSTTATTTRAGTGATSTTTGSRVLPVTTNPIHNTATAKTLSIGPVLVENNVDAAGAATDDHLEIPLTNTGTTELGNVEIFYTYTDPTARTSESYYARLPATFTIPAKGTRVAHFDNSGAIDHFPVNKFSLYYTSTNALDVEVMVSADGAAVQTTTVRKDAGGAEVPD